MYNIDKLLTQRNLMIFAAAAVAVPALFPDVLRKSADVIEDAQNKFRGIVGLKPSLGAIHLNGAHMNGAHMNGAHMGARHMGMMRSPAHSMGALHVGGAHMGALQVNPGHMGALQINPGHMGGIAIRS